MLTRPTACDSPLFGRSAVSIGRQESDQREHRPHAQASRSQGRYRATGLRAGSWYAAVPASLAFISCCLSGLCASKHLDVVLPKLTDSLGRKSLISQSMLTSTCTPDRARGEE